MCQYLILTPHATGVLLFFIRTLSSCRLHTIESFLLGLSGIGAALADKFIQEGAKVIAVGRRQERLDAFVEKHGSDKASGVKYDITDKANADSFVRE